MQTEQDRVSQNFRIIKLGNFEILLKNHDLCDYEDAKRIIDNYGDGWRLPSFYELKYVSDLKRGFGINLGNRHYFHWVSRDPATNKVNSISINTGEIQPLWIAKNSRISLCLIVVRDI